MKILGEARKHCDRSFIVEVSENELANLCGYYFCGADGCPEFEAGDEIPISEMYQRLYSLKRAEGDIARVTGSLQGIIDNLQLINPIIKNTELNASESEENSNE